MLKQETLQVKCPQCGGKGIVGSPRVTDGPEMCDKCRGTGLLNVRGFSNRPIYVNEFTVHGGVGVLPAQKDEVPVWLPKVMRRLGR